MHSPCLKQLYGPVVYAVQHKFTLNTNEQLPSKILLNPSHTGSVLLSTLLIRHLNGVFSINGTCTNNTEGSKPQLFPYLSQGAEVKFV